MGAAGRQPGRCGAGAAEGSLGAGAVAVGGSCVAPRGILGEIHT